MHIPLTPLKPLPPPFLKLVWKNMIIPHYTNSVAAILDPDPFFSTGMEEHDNTTLHELSSGHTRS